MSVDPLAETMPNYNPYTYTFNNPIMFTDPTGMVPEVSNDWKPNGDGTYTAESGDSAATLAKDAGISYAEANRLVQSQLGENYVDADGVEKSNVEVGDVVSIPNQVNAIVKQRANSLAEKAANELADKAITNEVKVIDNKINKLSTEIKDAHKKYNALDNAEKFDRIWIDRMDGGTPGRSAGVGKLQQMYERDSVNKSKERKNLRNNRQTLLKNKKTN